MTIAEPVPRLTGEYHEPTQLLSLTQHHPRIGEIYRMRQKYAEAKKWKKAEDPDFYDTIDTVTLAALSQDGNFRASLRLTRLGSGADHIISQCLSLEMLGHNTELRREAETRLRQPNVLGANDTVYDMTRFVIDSGQYEGALRDRHDAIKGDFLSLIGGAVAVTDPEAYADNSAIWLFTAEPEMRHLLERHRIRPTVLADASNDEGIRLQFCAIKPAQSFSEVCEGDSVAAARAARAIAFGRRVVS